MKDDLFALVEAAAALNAATDGMESLRPQRQAVLDALSNLSRRSEPVADELRLEWRDGPPLKPWSKEWFIAETIYGDRVVLTALPEAWSYDFKTADDTYMKAANVKRWMQFPDSEYIAPAPPAPDQAQPIDDEALVGWQPIETAPHGRPVLLAWQDWRDGKWIMDVGPASTGESNEVASSISHHGSATQWMPLPAAPALP